MNTHPAHETGARRSHASPTSAAPEAAGVRLDSREHHRRLADFLTRWSDDLTAELPSGRRDPLDEGDFLLGYQRALRDLAAHLRDGDALPGGPVDAA